MEFILWILAVILVISGIVSLVRGAVLWGIVLIIVGLLVGPGGVSIFTYCAQVVGAPSPSTAARTFHPGSRPRVAAAGGQPGAGRARPTSPSTVRSESAATAAPRRGAREELTPRGVSLSSTGGSATGHVYVGTLVRGRASMLRLELSGSPAEVLRQTRARALDVLLDAMRAGVGALSGRPQPGTRRAGAPAG